MTNPSANQSRPPRPGAYRYCACVSWAWPVLQATEVAHTNTAVPVLPEAIPDKESPAGEWVLQPALGVLPPPTTPAMAYGMAPVLPLQGCRKRVIREVTPFLS